MSLLINPLSDIVVFMTLGLWASLAASLRHFRPRPKADPAEPLLPMTLIKPVRGLDDAMEESFRSVVESDPEGGLQFIIAMESEDDPAYPVAKAFAAAHPARDILVLVTGPNRGRMDKIHNMIEALPRAKHPHIIFSDADCLAGPALLRGTSRAFREGYEAVFGLPYHPPAPGLGGLFFQIAFNHSFCVSAALSHYMGQMRFCAGAWMAYTKELLERCGGLEQFSHSIADDIALSTKVSELGARKYLLRDTVRVRETGTSVAEAFEHLAKWLSIVHSHFPRLYWLIPVVNLGVASLTLCGLCEVSGDRVWLGRGLLLAAMGSRVAVGWLQDRFAFGIEMPWYEYPCLAFVDLGTLVFWAGGFRSTIRWRGILYRLHPGGRSEILAR